MRWGLRVEGTGWSRWGVALVLVTVLGGWVPPAQGLEEAAPRAVVGFDLERFAGLWYEIARLPNRFQKRCARDVAAYYAPLEDGRLEVVNSCTRADGRRIAASGVARLADEDGPASALEIRFAPAVLAWLPWVWADYWVLDVDPEYEHALVGTPNGKHLWILARRPEMDGATWSRLVAVAAAQGYDTERLLPTPQTPREIPPGLYGPPADAR